MGISEAIFAEFQSVKDLKPILASAPPCLSVYMPLDATTVNHAAKVNAVQWRSCVNALKPKTDALGREAGELLDSISDWDSLFRNAKPQGKGKSVVVFRSRDVFLASWMEEPVRSRGVAGPHFYIRPLLPQLTRESIFYILALSQNNVRLLRATTSSSEEIALPPGIATSYDSYMNTAKPDHVSDNRSSAGPAAGTSKGVLFGTSSGREDKGEYLAHFFRQIDRGVNEVLRGSSYPLIPVGVDAELALYKTVNTYPHLDEEGARGAPDGLKSGAMHARALNAVLRRYERRVDAVLAEYNHKVGAGATNRLKEILPAAHEGRVLTLLVSDSLETPGSFDPSTYTIKGRESGTAADEDLLNEAVVEVIRHAGEVLVAPNGAMPNGAPLSAVFRFALSTASAS
jgi:release factor family 3